MKYVQAAVVVLLFAILQVAAAPRMTFGEIAPDFPLLLVAYFAVSRSSRQASVAGFVVGLCQDLFNPALLGLNALTKTITAYALSIASAKIEPDSWVLLAPLFCVAAFAHDAVYLMFFTGLDLGLYFVLLFTVALPSALYTAVVGVAVYKLAEVLSARVVTSFGKARS